MKKEFKIVGCIGCQMCVGLAPECFKMNQNGLAEIMQDADDNTLSNVESMCPVSAIKS